MALESVSVMYGPRTDIVALFEAAHGRSVTPVSVMSAAPVTARSALSAREEGPADAPPARGARYAKGGPAAPHGGGARGVSPAWRAREERPLFPLGGLPEGPSARGARLAHLPPAAPHGGGARDAAAAQGALRAAEERALHSERGAGRPEAEAHGGGHASRIPRPGSRDGAAGVRRGRRLVHAAAGVPRVSFADGALAPRPPEGEGGEGAGGGFSARARLRSDPFRAAGVDHGGEETRNVRSAHGGAGSGGLPPRPPGVRGHGMPWHSDGGGGGGGGGGGRTAPSVTDLRTLSHAAAHFLGPADQLSLALACRELARAHGRRVATLRVPAAVSFRALRDALAERFTHVAALVGVRLGVQDVRELAAALPAALELTSLTLDGGGRGTGHVSCACAHTHARAVGVNAVGLI